MPTHSAIERRAMEGGWLVTKQHSHHSPPPHHKHRAHPHLVRQDGPKWMMQSDLTCSAATSSTQQLNRECLHNNNSLFGHPIASRYWLFAYIQLHHCNASHINVHITYTSLHTCTNEVATSCELALHTKWRNETEYKVLNICKGTRQNCTWS